MEPHVIFYASGSKGREVRADGRGSHLPRGYHFVDRAGVTRGPYKSNRIACGARNADLNVPRAHKAPAGQCSYCDAETGTFHPSHDASKYCESGRRNHCSCDACF